MIAHTKIDIEENENDYYWVQVQCDNCGRKQQLAFHTGRAIHEYECPVCECESLKRIEL